MEVHEYWKFLVDEIGVPEDFIRGATYMNGISEYTLDYCLYYFTGYRDLNQYIEFEYDI